jgi:predicted Rossmann fold nucleotide-binding protein DprA/Smf involved in DNA uptake
MSDPLAPILTHLPTIRSGGQTGVDRAALDAALDAGASVTGWCPRGRRAEDGRIPERYPLAETATPEYAERTRRNVAAADATLILAHAPLAGGTRLTQQAAQQLGKPVTVADPRDLSLAAPLAAELRQRGVRDLNVAGPRASEAPEIYAQARAFVAALLDAWPEQ